MRSSPLPTGLAAVIALAMAAGCTHGWDDYDPRPTEASASSSGAAGSSSVASGGSSGTAGGLGGAGGAGTAAGGAGGLPVQGCAPPGATGYRAEVLADCPIAYFRLGEASGIDTVDEVAGMKGSLVNGAALGASGALDGDQDTAILLDGDDDSIRLDDVFDFPGVSFAFEAWIQPTLLDDNYRRVFDKESGLGMGEIRQGYAFFVRSPAPNAMYKNAVGFEIWLDGEFVGATHTTTPPALGKWTHVVTSVDAVTGAIRLYLDGVPVDEALLLKPMIDNPSLFYWGATSNGYTTFAGTLDELAVYDHPLSDERVAAHYKVGVGM